MDTSVCETCQKNPTALRCGLCGQPTCKRCAHFLGEHVFSFLPKVPDHLKHDLACPSCFEAQVAGDLHDYETTLERARDINVYFKSQGKETRLVKRIEKPIVVEECMDRDELIMRVAFVAAKMGYNSVVDLDLTSEKVRNGSYQKLKWRGTGVPVNVTPDQIPSDKSISHNPN